MPVSRRTLFAGLGAALPALALPPVVRAAPAPAVPAPPDLGTAEGWLTWIDTHRDQVSVFLHPVDADPVAHLDRQPRPLASSVKVAHLAAYANAVATGRLSPEDTVRVGDWERCYVPTDGGAHVHALEDLGIPLDETGLFAKDPDTRVTLAQLVSAMIRFSDSAAPDHLRDRLGNHAIRAAARDGGWTRADIRSMCGEYLLAVFPDRVPSPGTPTAVRRVLGDQLERRYRHDDAFRAQVLDSILTGLPPESVQQRWASGTSAATARQLHDLHRAIATGTYPARSAADLARHHLEEPHQENLPPGVAGIGYKGGSLPGVLTAGITVRYTDDRVASGTLLAHGDITLDQVAHGDPALPVLQALLDPAWRDRFVRVLAGSAR